MIEFFRWAATEQIAQRDWCVLGKGPTFSRRDRFPLEEMTLLGLNHTILSQAVFLGHAADLEVVEHCGDAIEQSCEWFLMPRRPHRDHVPVDRDLTDLLDDFPVLRRMDDAGRLLYYNLTSSPPVAGEPNVEVGAFSGIVAMRLLGQAGVRKVRSLGIDGGRTYSADFARFRDVTLLDNGAEGFDRQLAEIHRVAEEHGIDYEPLLPPLRIFIGADEGQRVAAQVLDHSIRSHTDLPVDILPMIDLPVPLPRDPANQPRTGFSFSRFLIPELCGYQGRALYVDADMQVFADLAELWDLEFGEHRLLCTSQTEVPSHHPGYEHYRVGRQYSVMLLDCSRLDWKIEDIVDGLDRGEYSYEDLMFDMCLVPDDQIADTIPPEWNHLEHHEPGTTRLLHYTIVETQPWKNDRNPLAPIWEQAFEAAVADGAVNHADVERLIERGDVKASLRDILQRAAAPSLGGGSVGDALRASGERITRLERENAALRGELAWIRSSPLVRLDQGLRKLLGPAMRWVRRRRARASSAD